MSSSINHIIVLGGGTAGWLTAAVLAARHQANQAHGVRVTLVESPDVKILGVGEGTWPTMRDTLRSVGIRESDFLRECDASFKQGSLFVGWRSGEANDRYLHPFAMPSGFFDTDMPCYWSQLHEAPPFADAVSPQWATCIQNLAPKQAQTPEYAGVLNYGYHLDAGKFAELLRRHCTENLGVTHIRDHVESVQSHPDGRIAALTGRMHGELSADFFVDCSGFSARLIGEHFNVPFQSQRHVLFNDTAIAAQVQYPDSDAPIASATLSTAQQAGWIWDIGLPTRRGTGYVFSSEHSDDEQAQRVLAGYLNMPEDSLSFRKISIRPGFRQSFWVQNCVAIGTSAGFIEPLEASALVMIELSAKMLADQLPQNAQHMAMSAKRFNQVFSYRWQRIIDFLKLHYVLSQRQDSAYWLDNRDPASIPDSLQELLAIWRFQSPSRNDFPQIEEIFPAASYQYVLYGMGYSTAFRASLSSDSARQKATAAFAANQQFTQRCLSGLPANRALLNTVRHQDLPPASPQ